MRIHSVIHGSRANGPGLRSVVWVQGCTLHCPGCTNPKTHVQDAGREIDPMCLASEVIRGAAADTEGITISGGEPMQQPADLHRFIRLVKAVRPQWSIGLFTGYSEAELAENPWWPSIQPMLDWALMGRWDRTQATPQSFAPSANQELAIWRRYDRADFERMIEVSIGPELTTITGIPL